MTDSLRDAIERMMHETKAEGLTLSFEPTTETLRGDEAIDALFGGYGDEGAWVHRAIAKE